MPHIMLEVKSTREWKTQKSELIEGFFFYPNFILNLLRNITKKKKRKKAKTIANHSTTTHEPCRPNNSSYIRREIKFILCPRGKEEEDTKILGRVFFPSFKRVRERACTWKDKFKTTRNCKEGSG